MALEVKSYSCVQKREKENSGNIIMAKTFLFVKDKNENEVTCVYEYNEGRFATERALLDMVLIEKRNLERLYPRSKFLIEQVSGPDITSVTKMFPETVGRTNVEDLKEKIIRTDISRYTEASHTYYIEEDGADRVISKHIVEGGTTPLSIIEREIWAVGRDLRVQNYGDLKIKASTPAPNEIRVNLIRDLGGKFVLGLNLWPPVEKGERRKISLEYTWIGLWDPLRKEGQDSGLVIVGVDTEHFEINILLPPGMDGQLMRDQEIGDLVSLVEDGRNKLIWRVLNAPPGVYSYKVKKLS